LLNRTVRIMVKTRITTKLVREKNFTNLKACRSLAGHQEARSRGRLGMD
jgi:hypothetical protein